MKNPFIKTLTAIIIISLISGCVQPSAYRENTNSISNETALLELRLATTTSTCDTGLLDVLNKKFEAEHNVRISAICEGTGKAIATGELGAADVVMVHSVRAELDAVARGNFINRTYLMYNYFVIIGPQNDPAEIREANSAAEAFGKIAASRSNFISRGDDSGTHKMELSIWKAANITPAGTWYQSVGRGMGETIYTTDVKKGYTLSDRGTYLAMKDRIKVRILFQSDKAYLFNPYHIMAVNPAVHPGVKHDLAVKYINYVTSPEAQDIIRNYGIDTYGEALFVPAEDASNETGT